MQQKALSQDSQPLLDDCKFECYTCPLFELARPGCSTPELICLSAVGSQQLSEGLQQLKDRLQMKTSTSSQVDALQVRAESSGAACSQVCFSFCHCCQSGSALHHSASANCRSSSIHAHQLCHAAMLIPATHTVTSLV